MIAALTRAAAFAWAGFPVLAVAVGLGIRAHFSFVNGRPTRTDDRVHLVRVHPNFADALEHGGTSTP
ncbi:MAG: hypothetical protein M3O70_15390 [Actinomycetota bacterium]|nr:hypothetical protein [Actinomycetota bacterium]